MPSTASNERRLSGRHVLIAFVGFFGVIFAVNGYFLYSALATHTGVVSQEPYRKGLLYNDRIAADERQAELGWTHNLDAATDGRFTLSVTDKAGAPVAGLRIEATVGRPSTIEFDRQLTFRETIPGTYAASSDPLAAGTWVASIEAYNVASANPTYRGRNRLWLKP